MDTRKFEIKLIEICALKRSGHHALMGWIVKNLYGLQPDFGFKLEFVSDSRLWIWNDVTNFEEHGKKLFYDSLKNSNIDTLMVNYEDEKTDYTFFHKTKQYFGPNFFNFDENIRFIKTNRIYYIRNFYDCLSSRLQHSNNQVHTFDYGKNYIDLWKEYAKRVISNPKQSIKYEDLVLKTDKCDEFLFENFGTHQRFNVDEVKGRNSSFGDNKNYLKRFDINLLSEETKTLIRNDNELHYLMGVLGYEYQKI